MKRNESAGGEGKLLNLLPGRDRFSTATNRRIIRALGDTHYATPVLEEARLRLVERAQLELKGFLWTKEPKSPSPTPDNR